MEEKKQQCDIELDRDVAQGTYRICQLFLILPPSLLLILSVLCRGCLRLK